MTFYKRNFGWYFFKSCRDNNHSWSKLRMCVVEINNSTYPGNMWSFLKSWHLNNIIWRQYCVYSSTKRRIHQREIEQTYFTKIIFLLMIYKRRVKQMFNKSIPVIIYQIYLPRFYQFQPLRSLDIRLECVIFDTLSYIVIREVNMCCSLFSLTKVLSHSIFLVRFLMRHQIMCITNNNGCFFFSFVHKDSRGSVINSI